LLRKLDYAFYSLLRGVDAETETPLPDFHGRNKLSTTEKVRVRGVVERTRVVVVEVAGEADGTDGGVATETDGDITEEDYDVDDDDAMDDRVVEGIHGSWEMEVARVYEKTIVELGMALESSASGGFG